MDTAVSLNRTTWALGTLLLALTICAPAHAQALQFVRVTCVPANGYLEIEYKTVEQEVFDVTHSGRTFADNGYLDPQASDSECKLGDVTYLVSSRQDAPKSTGTCGGAPAIVLTLRRNKTVLIDQADFGDICNGGASITRLWLYEGKATETPATMSLCISPEITDFKAHAPEPICPYLNAVDVALITPINQYRVTTCVNEDTCLKPDKRPGH